MNGAPVQDGGFINTALMGFWALVGAMMRGMSEWNDPATGRFSYVRAITGLATAAVLGEIAIAATIYLNIDIRLTGALAAVLGYVGPATTIGLVTKKFGGINESSNDDPAKGK